MTGNQTMVDHVRPRHLYSRDGTCTSIILCRRPPSLVTFHICYLFDRASIYEISILMTKFQCTIRYLNSLWISYFTVYCTWRWPHITFAYHAYSWPLYSYVSGTATCIFAVTCWYLWLYCTYEWFILPPRYSLLHFWGYYNVFRSSCIPLTSHIRGHML